MIDTTFKMIRSEEAPHKNTASPQDSGVECGFSSNVRKRVMPVNNPLLGEALLKNMLATERKISPFAKTEAALPRLKELYSILCNEHKEVDDTPIRLCSLIEDFERKGGGKDLEELDQVSALIHGRFTIYALLNWGVPKVTKKGKYSMGCLQKILESAQKLSGAEDVTFLTAIGVRIRSIGLLIDAQGERFETAEEFLGFIEERSEKAAFATDRWDDEVDGRAESETELQQVACG